MGRTSRNEARSTGLLRRAARGLRIFVGALIIGIVVTCHVMCLVVLIDELKWAGRMDPGEIFLCLTVLCGGSAVGWAIALLSLNLLVFPNWRPCPWWVILLLALDGGVALALGLSLAGVEFSR